MRADDVTSAHMRILNIRQHLTALEGLLALLKHSVESGFDGTHLHDDTEIVDAAAHHLEEVHLEVRWLEDVKALEKVPAPDTDEREALAKGGSR